MQLVRLHKLIFTANTSLKTLVDMQSQILSSGFRRYRCDGSDKNAEMAAAGAAGDDASLEILTAARRVVALPPRRNKFERNAFVFLSSLASRLRAISLASLQRLETRNMYRYYRRTSCRPGTIDSLLPLIPVATEFLSDKTTTPDILRSIDRDL